MKFRSNHSPAGSSEETDAEYSKQGSQQSEDKSLNIRILERDRLQGPNDIKGNKRLECRPYPGAEYPFHFVRGNKSHFVGCELDNRLVLIRPKTFVEPGSHNI